MIGSIPIKCKAAHDFFVMTIQLKEFQETHIIIE